VQPADAPPATLQIAGAVTKPVRWTSAQLATQFAADIRPLDYTLKGVHHTAKQAIPLLKLLEAANLKVNPHVKHGDLQFIVAAEGHDGYTVDFSYAELLAEIGNRPVWVALDEDGKALTGEAAPAELIVPGDTKPARWVHSLTRIVVIDGSQVADSVSGAEAK
jgi:DMSO/TMAO reductase YedYZ molybdopterin-dependent catalytic subunit